MNPFERWEISGTGHQVLISEREVTETERYQPKELLFTLERFDLERCRVAAAAPALLAALERLEAAVSLGPTSAAHEAAFEARAAIAAAKGAP